MDPRAGLSPLKSRKIFPLPEIKQGFLRCPACSAVGARTELPHLLSTEYYTLKCKRYLTIGSLQRRHIYVRTQKAPSERHPSID